MLVFLFTDIEGSTRLWEEHTGEMGAVISRHDAILREQIESCVGRLTKHTGDGVTAAFEGGQPIACALETQKRFAAEPWGQVGELRIRAGLHAGAAEWIAGAEPAAGDYFGPAVNCAARIMSAAWGGQVLLTPEVLSTAVLPEKASTLDLGEHLLKNVTAPKKLLQLLHPDLRWHEFPPPRTLSGESIRRQMVGRGSDIASLNPPAIAMALISAILVPILQGDLSPDSPALLANLGVLDDLGTASLRSFAAEFAARLQARQTAGQDIVIPKVQQELEGELLERWKGSDETALALRADASQLLRAVQGVQAAMTAATGEVKVALAQGLADLGSQFGEFRWMLAGVQDTLAEMRALQRQHLAMTEEILQHQRERTRIAPAPALLAVEPPAFLEDGDETFEQPVFVAREPELARLDTFLQAALGVHGSVCFVLGGSGRGKTALLTEFASRAMAAVPELLVARGTCNAYSGVGDPYLPFREVLEMLAGDVEARWAAGAISRDHARRLWQALPDAVEALLAHGSHVIPALVPGEPLLARASAAGCAEPWLARLRERVERSSDAAEGLEQSHLFQQVSNVLHALSQVHPLLLILDDLQWVDRASAGLLFHLGRRLEGARILIAGAYRPEEITVGLDARSRQGEHPPRVKGRHPRVSERHARVKERHPLEKALAEFKRLYGDVWQDLAESDAPGGRRFVDALLETEPNRLGSQFRQTLTERAGGHPLFTVELLRAMQERGDLEQDEAGRWVEGSALDWEALPARVEGVISERLERLGEDLRQILTVACVEGEDFTADVVARVQAVETRELVRRLSGELQKEHRLVSSRGMRQLDARRLALYRFQHHQFQRYLYNNLDEIERVYLHGDVGSVLEALYGEQVDEVAVQLARHFQIAGDREREARYARLAGERALARYANDEAEGHFRTALELVKAEAERADLLWELGRALSRQSRCEEAIGVWREGIDQYQALGNLDGVARLYAGSARAAWNLGDLPRGLVICREGVEAVGDAPESPDLADLVHETARACHFNGLREEAGALTRHALEMAERLGDVRVQAEALASWGILPEVPFAEVVSALTRAIELAESAGLLAQAARAHNNLGAWLIDTQARRKHFLRAAELGRHRGEILGELFCARAAAHFSLVLGDLAAVEDALPSQRQLLAAAGEPGAAALKLRTLEFELLRFQGELAQALKGLQSLQPRVRETGDLQGLAWLNENLARACIWEEVGQEEEIEAMLREALDLGYMGAAVPAKALQSVQRARQGEPEAARRLLTAAREQAAEQDATAFWEPELLWAEANLAMAGGHWSEALAAFEATVDAMGRANQRWYRARTLVDWAGAHLARGESGDRERALELLREAEAEFEAMGAHGYVERVRGRLEELGAGSATA